MNAKEISAQSKENLINQLETLLGKTPAFYLKFCSEERFAEDVCNGDLYANTAEYFRKKEIESGERGQGDKNELVLPIKAERIHIFDNKTGSLFTTIDGADVKIQYKDDDIIPIVCFVGIPLKDMVLIEADDTHATFKLPFSDAEYETMSQRFGKFCVIMGGRELEGKIEGVFRSYDFDYIFDRVEYCPQNRLDRMEAFAKSDKRRFLYKNEDLRYQREYRLAVAMQIPEDHYIHIGKLKTAKVIATEEIMNLAFSIEYISHQE